MWPWSDRSAYVSSLLLLIVLVGGFVVGASVSDWPPSGLGPWLLLAAVLLGLAPVVMRLLDFAAARSAKVGITKFLSLDFSSGSGRVDAGAHVGANIVSATDVQDSGGTAMRAALTAATETNIVEVNLGVGDSWWPTRLLVLASGAARQGKPDAIAFVAQQASVSRVFQGWAHPAELVEQLLRRYPDYAAAYWQEQRDWQSSFANPLGYSTWRQTKSPPAAGADEYLPVELEREMQLTRALGDYEPPPHGISAADLQLAVGPILHSAVVDIGADERTQAETILSADGDYIGVVNGDDYLGLMALAKARRDLLRSVVLGSPQPS